MYRGVLYMHYVRKQVWPANKRNMIREAEKNLCSPNPRVDFGCIFSVSPGNPTSDFKILICFLTKMSGFYQENVLISTGL